MDKLMKKAEDHLAKGRVQIAADEAVLGINHIAADQSGVDELVNDALEKVSDLGTVGAMKWLAAALSSNAAQSAGQEPVILPEWHDISEKDDRKETLTAVERFIYNNEPAGNEDEEKFRRELSEMLQEVTTHPSSAAQVEETRNAALDEAITAVEDAGGDNDDYHADAIRALKTAAPSKGEE